VLLPALQERIAGLYAELSRGDAGPTAAQAAAGEAARQALAGELGRWHALQADLPALNRQLKAARLAPLRPDLAPPRDRNAADED
jgi:hypothetical protein